MPSPLPYMQLYVRDWMASSTVQLMSVTAEGIYLRLCMVQWEDGELPESTDRLRRLARADSDEWSKFEEFIDECFPVIGEVRLNPRVSDDRKYAIDHIEKKSRGGKATAEKRWGAHVEPEQPQSDSLAIAEQQDSNSSATAKPSTSSSTSSSLKESPISPKESEKERDDVFFERVKSEYPQRDGDLCWKKAETKIKSIPLKERTAAIQGVIEYRKYCETHQKVKTPYVKQAPTFFNGDVWREYQPVQERKKREWEPDTDWEPLPDNKFRHMVTGEIREYKNAV